MFLLKVATILLAVLGVHCFNFALNALIRKISNGNGIKVVYVVGGSDEYFSDVLSEDVGGPVMVLESTSSLLGNISPLEHNGIFVTEALQEDPAYVENLKKLTHQVRLRKFAVILGISTDNLRWHFAFFAEQKFTRIFGVIEDVYIAYHPYSDSQLQAFSLSDPLPDARKNLNGHSLRIAAYNDLPRVYSHEDSNGRTLLTGYAGEMFRAFLRRHNATFNEVHLHHTQTDMAVLVAAAIEDEIDFIVNPYDGMDGVAMSYPISIQKWGIMVPIIEYLNPTQYFVRPFTPATWLFIGITFVYIVAMDVATYGLTQMPVEMWTATSRTMLMMLALPIERPIRRAYRFHVLVLLFCFIMGNLYSSHLQSFLTVFIKVRQCETIHDMIENRIPLMMVSYEWNSDLFSGVPLTVIPVEHSVFLRERNSMNPDFAYAVGTDKAQYLINIYATFAKPRFHIIRESLGRYFVGYLLVEHSPYLEILNSFIIDVQATGLLEKWSKDAVQWGLQSGLVNITRSAKEDSRPLTPEHFYFAWLILGCGLLVSSAVLAAEMKFGRRLH